MSILGCTFIFPHDIFMLLTNVVVQDGYELRNFSYTFSSTMKIKHGAIS
jgi:hypothetical protein